VLGLLVGFLASVITCKASIHVNPVLGRINAKQELRAHLNPNNGSNTSTSDLADGPGGTPCPHS